MSALGEAPRQGTGQAATPLAEIDNKVRRLEDATATFSRVTAAEKSKLLDEVRRRFYELAPRLTEAACRAKGIDLASELYGEEFLGGPVATLHYARLLARSLRDIARRGLPELPPDAIRERSFGSSARLVPLEPMDHVRLATMEAEVWLDVPPERANRERAAAYRSGAQGSRVELVLGAGNIAAIPALDALHASFVHGNTCLLKMSPVNEYLGPLFEAAFAPLVRRGFLELIYGGPEVGAYACDHPGVQAIHITGSSATHDRIVWGSGEAAEANRRSGSPRLAKPVTSELGNITPVIVPPGDYSDGELDHLARTVAGMIAHNASFNCLSAKMLVLPSGPGLRAELLARLARVLEGVPTRRAYYPGASARYEKLVRSAPDLLEIGERTAERLPWALIRGLSPDSDAEQFRTEPFCSLLSEVSLPARDAIEFLAAATDFANERLWGTLTATVIKPKAADRDPALRDAYERAVERLRYGTVTVNSWPGLAFGLSELPWGGAPGSTLEDVQSGIGFSHNALMLEHVRKVVLRAPLAAVPVPLWYPGRPLRAFAKAFADYEYEPGPLKLGKLAMSALKS